MPIEYEINERSYFWSEKWDGIWFGILGEILSQTRLWIWTAAW